MIMLSYMMRAVSSVQYYLHGCYNEWDCCGGANQAQGRQAGAARGWFNIKMLSYQYMDFHYKDHLNFIMEISIPGKMFFYIEAGPCYCYIILHICWRLTGIMTWKRYTLSLNWKYYHFVESSFVGCTGSCHDTFQWSQWKKNQNNSSVSVLLALCEENSLGHQWIPLTKGQYGLKTLVVCSTVWSGS